MSNFYYLILNSNYNIFNMNAKLFICAIKVLTYIGKTSGPDYF